MIVDRPPTLTSHTARSDTLVPGHSAVTFGSVPFGSTSRSTSQSVSFTDGSP